MWPFKKSLTDLHVKHAEALGRHAEIVKVLSEIGTIPKFLVCERLDLAGKIAKLKMQIDLHKDN